VNNETVDQPWSNGSKPIRVLMADPDASHHQAYRERFFEEGIEVTAALGGVECIARMRERAPDVLVLEPKLPWGGGEGVLAIMGEVPELAIVPVMVLTSCRDARLLKAVMRFPVSDYQLKPLAAARLVARLHAILAHPKLRFTLAE
jgi:two-component system, sensor histidine kinase and response regulator